ncbi:MULTISPECIES: hypothetical protein [unclassified Variovorax]|uniref:hypothetical protein n=1 Tax=unclassified Variovorax TaxID=663243 RepID=UPI00117D8D9B|nr:MULTISPECIES: hypothetical protein [unclassified Variovorax]
MCNDDADTGEHKIKKSLLVELHGSGSYKGANAMLHVKEGKERKLQGPGSDLIKYEKCLCSACNNNKSQPFDLAYDKFFKFVIDHESEIVERRVIDFSDVYGNSFAEDQTNLYKYFVKVFGCDLSSHGLPVPQDLKDLLDKKQFKTRLRITFAVNEDMLVLGGAKRCPLGIGKMNFWPANASVQDERSYAWSIYFSFLEICFWYAKLPTGPFGSVWTADSQWIYLGWLRPMSPEQRKEFQEKVRTVAQSGINLPTPPSPAPYSSQRSRNSKRL